MKKALLALTMVLGIGSAFSAFAHTKQLTSAKYILYGQRKMALAHSIIPTAYEELRRASNGNQAFAIKERVRPHLLAAIGYFETAYIKSRVGSRCQTYTYNAYFFASETERRLNGGLDGWIIAFQRELYSTDRYAANAAYYCGLDK